jgi:hypothetical protein
VAPQKSNKTPVTQYTADQQVKLSTGSELGTNTKLVEQQVKLPTGSELRKNVNVLNTVGSENPVLNPFLQNQATTQSSPQSSSKTQQQNNDSKK